MILRRSKSRGFTLLELVLVMLIAATALAIAAPRLAGWSKGQKLRSCAEEFVRMTRLARTKAVSNATVYRILLDSATVNFKLQVQSGTEFTEVKESLSENAAPLVNGKIEVVRSGTEEMGASSVANGIDFYPSGRTQPMRVRITDETGHSIEIECTTPAEDFRIVSTSSP